MSEKKSDYECFAKLSNSLYALADADRENFSSLLNTVYEFSKGKEVMNDVAFKGYKFLYEAMYNVNGACDYDHQTVRLNSYFRQNDLAPILVHECTHVQQVDRLMKQTGVEKAGDFINALDACDFIKLNRALEADACAHQAAFAYQMKDKYPQVFKKEMETPMMKAYVSEMEKSGDETKAMQASFKAWYKFKNYQETYDNQFVKQISANIANKQKNPKAKTKTISNEQIVSLCLHNGKSYISPDFLSEAENMAVSEKDKEKLIQAGDKSAARLPVRGQKKEKAPVAAVLKAKKAKDR
ncbi:MAG: hypothetical protein J5787_07945 [Alphaproteobacteria bacterium]|nr:hypothetical protein [Alphaproteobacteria bacterium]MBO4643103.1 hypothetical protein [Alphaproteobacteria bacterium]